MGFSAVPIDIEARAVARDLARGLDRLSVGVVRDAGARTRAIDDETRASVRHDAGFFADNTRWLDAIGYLPLGDVLQQMPTSGAARALGRLFGARDGAVVVAVWELVDVPSVKTGDASAFTITATTLWQNGQVLRSETYDGSLVAPPWVDAIGLPGTFDAAEVTRMHAARVSDRVRAGAVPIPLPTLEDAVEELDSYALRVGLYWHHRADELHARLDGLLAQWAADDPEAVRVVRAELATLSAERKGR